MIVGFSVLALYLAVHGLFSLQEDGLARSARVRLTLRTSLLALAALVLLILDNGAGRGIATWLILFSIVGMGGLFLSKTALAFYAKSAPVAAIGALVIGAGLALGIAS